tara:strand:- start:10562 stop:11680 length:1119 start_codon:yes stop_codon:yes gene_type:complete
MTYKFGISSSPTGTVTDVAGTQSTDASTGVVFSVTLNTTGTNTLENPTNLQEGQEYVWRLEQDSVTPVDVTFGDNFYFATGTAPTITQVAGAVDILRATALDDGTGNIKLYSKFEADVKAVTTALVNTYSMELVQASSQYCALGSTSALDKGNTDPFSISLWVRPTAALTGTLALVTKMAGSPTGNGYALYYFGGDLYMHLRGNLSPLTQIYWYLSGAATYTPVNDWTHVVMVYDGNNNATAAKLYTGISGIDASPTEQTTTQGGSALTASMSNAASFKVGAFNGPASFMDVMVDEVSFWDKALSSSEVADIYNGGTPTDLTGSSDLVSWWRFGDDASDDFTGSTGQITDQVGSNDLIPYNTTSANKVTNVP